MAPRCCRPPRHGGAGPARSQVSSVSPPPVSGTRPAWGLRAVRPATSQRSDPLTHIGRPNCGDPAGGASGWTWGLVRRAVCWPTSTDRSGSGLGGGGRIAPRRAAHPLPPSRGAKAHLAATLAQAASRCGWDMPLCPPRVEWATWHLVLARGQNAAARRVLGAPAGSWFPWPGGWQPREANASMACRWMMPLHLVAALGPGKAHLAAGTKGGCVWMFLLEDLGARGLSFRGGSAGGPGLPGGMSGPGRGRLKRPRQPGI